MAAAIEPMLPGLLRLHHSTFHNPVSSAFNGIKNYPLVFSIHKHLWNIIFTTLVAHKCFIIFMLWERNVDKIKVYFVGFQG